MRTLTELERIGIALARLIVDGEADAVELHDEAVLLLDEARRLGVSPCEIAPTRSA